jgi:hypothetical protein
LQTLVLLLVGLVLTVLVTVEAAPAHQVKKWKKIKGIASQGFQSATSTHTSGKKFEKIKGIVSQGFQSAIRHRGMAPLLLNGR